MIALLAAAAWAAPVEARAWLAAHTPWTVSVGEAEGAPAGRPASSNPVGLAAEVPLQVRADAGGGVLLEVGGATDPFGRVPGGGPDLRRVDLHADLVLLTLRDAWARRARPVRPYGGAGAGGGLAWFAMAGAPDLVTPVPRFLGLAGVVLGSGRPRVRVEARALLEARVDAYGYAVVTGARRSERLIRPGGAALELAVGLGFR